MSAMNDALRQSQDLKWGNIAVSIEASQDKAKVSKILYVRLQESLAFDIPNLTTIAEM